MGAIIDFLSGLMSFLVNIVSSIIWFVTNLPSMLAIITDAVGYAPEWLMPFLTISLAATALFAIIRLL